MIHVYLFWINFFFLIWNTFFIVNNTSYVYNNNYRYIDHLLFIKLSYFNLNKQHNKETNLKTDSQYFYVCMSIEKTFEYEMNYFFRIDIIKYNT